MLDRIFDVLLKIIEAGIVAILLLGWLIWTVGVVRAEPITGDERYEACKDISIVAMQVAYRRERGKSLEEIGESLYEHLKETDHSKAQRRQWILWAAYAYDLDAEPYETFHIAWKQCMGDRV